jgi:prepilin-type N-terminal cleavage/methylation domain-containing protein
MQKFRRLDRDDGFTVVELMVVVLIIGVLVGIAVVSFTVSISASKKAACRANLKIIRDELVVYYTVNGDDPAALDDLVPDYVGSDEGLRCPESGEDYLYDPVTTEVSCPYHTDL